METVAYFIFLGSKITVDSDCIHKIKRACSLKEDYDKPRQCTEKWRHHFADKGLYSQSYGFSSSHVQMWELAHKEGWMPKNWCFWIVVLEKTLENPLDCRKNKPVNPKGNQHWIFIGRPILWPPDAKNWLIGKAPDAGKDWSQEKGATGDEMVVWHHWIIGHESEQTPADSEGQGSLACCSSWGCSVRHKLVTEKQQQHRCVSVYT